MKRSILIITTVLYTALSYSQSGINTQNPRATLDIAASAADPAKTDGVIAPSLTGDQLKAKDNLYDADLAGAFVYVTAAADPVTAKTQNVTAPGYYYFDGTVWVSFKSASISNSDAARFLGGTVYVRFNSTATGTPNLDNSKVIGGGNGNTYAVGTLSATSTKGGIVSVAGQGYTISNPSNGLFDIQFDVPMTEIYGISVNLVDAYATITPFPPGTYPVQGTPGSRLQTTDNAQVSFISDTIIRIKTGDTNGILSNNCFTFLVTGK